MKRVTISFGIEVTSAIVTVTRGKVVKVIKKVSIDNSKYYEDSGILNYQEIVKELKKSIGKELKSLNVYVVIPDYITDISYVDSSSFDGKKEKELPDCKDKTLKNKRLSYIGESNDKSISQIIYFSESTVKAFIKELYKSKINVVELLSHYTALHNSIAAFNDSKGTGRSKTRIMVDLGVRRTGLIIFINNLPVYIKNSDNNLIRCYERLRSVHENLEFNEFIRVVNNISLDGKVETEEEKEEYEVEAQLVREIKFEILDMLKVLRNEIKEVYDLADERYRGENIEFVASSNLVKKYLDEYFTSFDVSNHKLAVSIDTQRNELDISDIEDVTIDLILCIGSVIESLKKGTDYYE